MVPAEKRVYTPETIMEKLALQAIERGKLQNLLFSDPTRLSHRTLSTLLGVLVKLPPAKQLLATKQLKSTFVQALLWRSRRKGQQRAEATT
jgi:CRP-like cAMP-binding protein